MKPDCRNDCIDPIRFPKRPSNRPGLPRIDYRIGTYSDIREALLRNLDKNEVLSSWSYRDHDDPGIALLEGASILGDILTFYQELYANEAYLRTAQWRESVADLVRLLGYRLSPGLGGKGTFAFEVNGDKPVVIPKGFAIKAQIEGLEQSVEFESTDEVKAYPHLSQLNLYRPRYYENNTSGNQLDIQQVDGSNDVTKIDSLDLKVGDRLMIVQDITGNSSTITSAIKKHEILIVTDVQKILDRTVLTFEGSLSNFNSIVKAYRIGRTFHHFGYNAPDVFERTFENSFQPKGSDQYLKSNEMPLDVEVENLAVGGKLICQGFIRLIEKKAKVGVGLAGLRGEGRPYPVRATKEIIEVREIAGLRNDSLKWGNLSGPSTILVFNKSIKSTSESITMDIRKLRLYEVKGPEMTLRSPAKWSAGIFTDSTLNYFGTYQQVQALAGRSLLLERQDGETQQLTVSTKSSDLSLDGKDDIHSWMWSLTLDRKPYLFRLEDFDESDPKVIAYGNLVEATQGKTEKEAVLGNGDAREIFQTFKLPKSPLTYLNSVEETPPEVPELQIYVNDRLWKRVNSFFGKDSQDEIYIVREDSNGDSWVQFGDGKTGSRLPSGLSNIVAIYRTGTGAHGILKENTTVQPGGSLDRLDQIKLAGIITGGSQPESGDSAKEAAPGKIQSLGRLVSLSDFETETLSLPGVSKVSAIWDLDKDATPTFSIIVLMESGREKEIGEISRILNNYNICRGPQRFSINVSQGDLQYVYLDIVYAIDVTFKKDVVEKAIEEALGVTGEEGSGIDGSNGLFGLRQRKFGQGEYATRIEGIVQNVNGIVWAKVNALDSLGTGNPSALNLPLKPVFKQSISCEKQNILCLHIEHLILRQDSICPVNKREVC